MAALNPSQSAALKADIAADATLNAQPSTMDGAILIAAFYNATASPDFWVWRSLITEAEVTQGTSVDATTWSWPAYIARSTGEQEGWSRLFGGAYATNPSLANVRQGFSDIFSGGTAPAAAQRAHLLAICRRKATRVEKLFAVTSAAPPIVSGNLGSATSVATMAFEGPVSPNDVYNARLT